MDRLLATKSEGVGLIVRAISFQDFQLMWSQSTNVTDGRTDRRTDGRHAIPRPRICTKVHCAVKIHSHSYTQSDVRPPSSILSKVIFSQNYFCRVAKFGDVYRSYRTITSGRFSLWRFWHWTLTLTSASEVYFVKFVTDAGHICQISWEFHCQSMHIYLNNNHAKFYPDPICNDGA